MNYSKPPIVEAVIEIRFVDPLGSKNIEKLKERFIKDYPNWSRNDSTTYKVDTRRPKEPVIDQVFDSYKLTSGGLDNLMIRSNALVVSRLAPYTDWDDLTTRVKRDFAAWKDVVGFKRIDRLGVRYINRVDVPLPESKKVRIEDFFTLYVNLVDPEAMIGHYAIQLAMKAPGNDHLQMVVNAGTAPPALIDHHSFLLDLDLGFHEPPQRDEEIFQSLANMRLAKNEAFESFVTDKARALFV